MTDSLSKFEPVEQLAAEFLARYRRGERPALTEYTRKYPDLAELIREYFPAMVLMEELGSVAGETRGPDTPTGRDRERIPEQLGEYRILREMGRGGMGIVYEAVQETLGRHVALKVLPFHGLLSRTHLERFRREARAAARLHHTNIVPVFGVGEHGGIHYYAMQFIQGQTLDEVLREVRRLRATKGTATDPGPAPEADVPSRLVEGLLSGQFRADATTNAVADAPRSRPAHPVPPAAAPAGSSGAGSSASLTRSQSEWTSQPGGPYFRSVAHIGLQVAEALEYAHREGILHRDIKPSNLLLDTSGRAWITDFGLAKAEDWDELTSPGDVVGTVRYMAPERFQGQADGRSDVYGLGITLYEMLTLRPAFEDSNRARLMERVAHEEPPRPRKVDRQVPRDLETVVLKATAKEPARRYPTAAALAEDLRRFLADRPIQARRAPLRERAWRWCRRNPVLAVTATLAAVALVAVAGLSIALAIHHYHAAAQAEAQRDQADQAASRLRHEQQQTHIFLQEAQTQRRLAEQSTANLALDRALYLCEQGDVAPGLLWLTRSLAIAPHHVPALQRVIRANLAAWQGELPPLRALLPHGDSVGAIAFSPDAKKIVTGSWDRQVRLWDAQTGEQLGPPLWFGSAVLAAAFSPDGRTVFTGGGAAQAQLWDVATGKPLGGRLAAKGDIAAAAFSHDGRTVLTAGWGGKVERWDAATGKFLATVAAQGTYIYALAISSDGQTLVTGADDKTARLWDAVTGHPKGEPLRHHEGPVRAVALSHDGTRLLTGSMDGTAQVWDAASHKPLGLPLQHRRPVFAVAFSPDDRMMLTGSLDGTAQVWDIASHKPLGLPLQHRSQVLAAAFSPDGKTVVTGGTENAARMWDVTALVRTWVSLPKRPSWVRGMAFGPSGRHLLIGGDYPPVQLWDLGTQQPVGKPARHNDRVRAVAFHPDGTMFLTAGLDDAMVQLWEVSTGKPLGAPLRLGNGIWAATFSPDGRTILTAQDDGTVQRWDTARAVRGSPDPAPAGVPLRHPGGARAMASSPDGRTILTAGMDGTARLWDAATGQAIGRPLPHAAAVWAAAFSPDGRTIATGSWDGTVRLWDAATAQAKGGPLQHQGKVEAVAFSPDGRTLVTGSFDNNGRLWDVATGKPIGPPLSHDDIVLAVAFHPAGKMVATAGGDGIVRLWPVPVPKEGSVADLVLQTELLTGMQLEPGGAATLLNAQAWRQRCWRRELPLDSLLIALCPVHPEPYERRGRVYEALGQRDKAVADWTEALRWTEPRRRAELHSRRGLAYLTLNDDRRAAADFQRALELQPDRADIANGLAWLYLTGPEDLRDAPKALYLATRAVARAPGDWNYWNTLGVAHYRLGQYQQAIPALERSLRESRGAAAAFDLFPLAMCHARQGDAARARDCYARAAQWLPEQEGKLSPRWRDELRAFRAEAEAVLASLPATSQSR